MSLGFQIFPDQRFLFIRGQGVITQPERIQTMLAWLEDPQYQLCTDALFDITAAESTPTMAELREILATLRQHLPVSGPRKLAVVTGKPIAFAVARVFGGLVHHSGNLPLHVRVFLDREGAWSWLRPGEPPPDAP